MDEDAGSLAGVVCTESQPLVENHEDQVAKETDQEEQLGKKQQVNTEFLSEMPEKRGQGIKMKMCQVIVLGLTKGYKINTATFF